MSAPTSPLSPMDTHGGHRLSSRRRGSMAAPDPFGTLLVHDKERGMSSTLTITRAPPQIHTQSVDVKARRRRSTDYHGKPMPGESPGARISFAFSAFTPTPKDTNASLRGVDGVPRPASPPRSPARSSFFAAKVLSLTPIQVCEVAQQCKYPNSQPSTPGGNAPPLSTPVSYTPLPDAVYLPFLDRPSEVKALLSTPPTSTMFSLLAQTFPTSLITRDETDPVQWTYTQLERWLTQVDRNEADDLEWVQKARVCISARSELIWERVKGALGVPPELDGFPGSGGSELNSIFDGKDVEGVEDAHDHFDDAWVEPIISTSSSRTPSRSPVGELGGSSSLGRQNINCMEDISEDTADPVLTPSSPSPIHGLRILTSPLESPARHETSPVANSAGSFSHPNAPYDPVAERGPGNPLFPSSFANLAIGPTLSANNTSLRVLTAPPPSAYPPLHTLSRPHLKASSWADGSDSKRQEYALSVGSVESKIVE